MHVRSLAAKIALIAAATIVTVFGIGTYFLAENAGSVIDQQNAEIQNSIADTQALDAGKTIDMAAHVGEDISTVLAALKAKDITDRTTIDETLRTLLEKNTNVLGAWSGWEPNALDGRDTEFAGKEGHDQTGRFMPYWNRSSGKPVREVLLDYTNSSAGAYYMQPLAENRPVAVEPYLYPIAGKNVLITSFSFPIVVDGKAVGVAGIDINLESLNTSMQKIKPFGTGFVSLVSKGGLAVTHPNMAAVGQPLAKFDAPSAEAAQQAIETNTPVSKDAPGPDGKSWSYRAVPIGAGGTTDRWAVVVAVPEATLQETVNNTKFSMAALSAACIVLIAGLMFMTLRALVGTPLEALTKSFDRMAGGDLDTNVPGADRTDEIGGIGKAVIRLRDSLQEKARIEAEQKAAHDAAMSRERKEQRIRLAQEFQQAVGSIVDVVSQTAGQLEGAALSLTETAETTQQLSTGAAAASEQTSANVEGVAAASEQLASTVTEISRQVQESSTIANQAVQEAARTNDQVSALSQSADRIGDIIGLINTIAGQTNLLALNATIEAARAGDAGKGFAVVAQEVKALAAQTSKATNEIASQVSGMQSATREAVAAIKQITTTINMISEITGTIAAAVEEQDATTKEISRNVTEAARGTSEVASSITDVTKGAAQTGSASSQVLTSAKQLANESGNLHDKVETFLATIRAA